MPTNVPIQSTVLTSSVSSVTFTGISQNYTDLVIKGTGTINTGAESILLRFNGDTGGNYSFIYAYGTGSGTGASGRGTGTTFALCGTFNSTQVAGFTAHINGYSNSNTFKTVIDRRGSSSSTIMDASTWRNTAPITSITIFPENGKTFSAGTTFDVYGISPAGARISSAFGGTDIYYDSTYAYHVFAGTGTFTPNRALNADILVVAGGGGGGGSVYEGGGGGAGGLLGFTSQSLAAGTSYAVVVGAGGPGGAGGSRGSQGTNSQFASLTACVGGGSGAHRTSTAGGNGGSGGGGSFNSGAGGSPTTGQGYAGGNGASGQGEAGGGGGAGGAGGNSSGNGTGGGVGGVGLSTYSSWGLATNEGQNVAGTYYFAGGGGGGSNGEADKAGGFGGGGGGKANGAGVPGTTNTGGGGGGGGSGTSYTGGNGGSGIVIVRYVR